MAFGVPSAVAWYLENAPADEQAALFNSVAVYISSNPNRKARLAHALLSFIDARGGKGDRSRIGWKRLYEAKDEFFQILQPSRYFRNAPSNGAIQNFVIRTSAGFNQESHYAFLMLLVIHQFDESPAVGKHCAYQEAIAAEDIFAAVRSALRTRASVVDESKAIEAHDIATAASLVAKFLKLPSLVDRNLYTAFFPEIGPDSIPAFVGTKNYAIYRFSAEAQYVVKTFLQVNTPRTHNSELPFFSFRHYYREGDIGSHDASARRRRSSGVVVRFEGNVYWIGGTAPMLADGSLGQNRGIKVIAAPYREIEASGMYFTGLAMSTRRNYDPICARVAFVETDLTHSDTVGIGRLKINKFCDDLVRTTKVGRGEHFTEGRTRTAAEDSELRSQATSHADNILKHLRNTRTTEGLAISLPHRYS